MSPGEWRYRADLAELLRRRALGEIDDQQEDETDADLERLWLALSEDERLRIQSDVAAIVGAKVSPLDEYRLVTATLREPKVESVTLDRSAASVMDLAEAVMT